MNVKNKKKDQGAPLVCVIPRIPCAVSALTTNDSLQGRTTACIREVALCAGHHYGHYVAQKQYLDAEVKALWELAQVALYLREVLVGCMCGGPIGTWTKPSTSENSSQVRSARLILSTCSSHYMSSPWNTLGSSPLSVATPARDTKVHVPRQLLNLLASHK